MDTKNTCGKFAVIIDRPPLFITKGVVRYR